MDVNGDGLVDVVIAYADAGNLQLTLLLAKSDGSGFSDPVNLPATDLPSNAILLPMDVDGNGCVDLVCAYEDDDLLCLTVLKAIEVSGQWTLQEQDTSSNLNQLPWGGQLLPMDVNGDGLTDLVYGLSNEGNIDLTILLSDGNSFAASADGTSTAAASGGQIISMDFNGDGMVDLVYAYNDDDNLAMTLLLSEGDQGLVEQAASPLPSSATALPYGGSIIPIDVNGDGKDDLVYAVPDNDTLTLYVLLSNGVSFEPPVSMNTTIPYFLNDPNAPVLLPMEVNGDGLTDLVVAVNDNENIDLYVLLSTGSGFALQSQASQPLTSTAWGGTLLPLDLNGDGKTDLLCASASESNLSMTGVLAAGAYPDLMTQVTNGFAGQIKIAYNR